MSRFLAIKMRRTLAYKVVPCTESELSGSFSAAKAGESLPTLLRYIPYYYNRVYSYVARAHLSRLAQNRIFVFDSTKIRVLGALHYPYITHYDSLGSLCAF